MKKDVIYIDIEDDITAIIRKLKQSPAKVVALVPPKRAGVLNSIVNLKLLGKAAAGRKKQLVLVTADETLKTLAGGLGLYVAPNLTTPPKVPQTTMAPKLPSAVIAASEVNGKEAPPASELPAVHAKHQPAGTGSDSGWLANLKHRFKRQPDAVKKQSKLPDFTRFRTRIILAGVGLVLLGIGWWLAVAVLPRAEVKLFGQTSRVQAEFTMTADLAADELDTTENVISAERQSVDIVATAQAPATGEENVGERATGELEIRNCDDGFSLVENTRFVFNDGTQELIFRSTEPVTVGDANCGFFGSGEVVVEVAVRADEGGERYNIEATNSTNPETDLYEIVNFSQADNDRLIINGSDMTGGTDEVITVVSQNDVATAREELAEPSESEIINQLKAAFSFEQPFVLQPTLNAGEPDDTVAPEVGVEADTVTITRTVRYRVVAVEQSALEQLVQSNYQAQIGDQQQLVSFGLDEAEFTLAEQSDDRFQLNVDVRDVVGPDVDIPALQEQLAGQAFTEAIATAEAWPGILRAEIELSPFWVAKMPANPDKINIEVDISSPDTAENETP